MRCRRRLINSARDGAGEAFGGEHSDFREVAQIGLARCARRRRREDDIAVHRRMGGAQSERDAVLRSVDSLYDDHVSQPEKCLRPASL